MCSKNLFPDGYNLVVSGCFVPFIYIQSLQMGIFQLLARHTNVGYNHVIQSHAFIVADNSSGRWEQWLHFFIGAVSHTAIDAIELCTALQTLHKQTLKLVLDSNVNMELAERLLSILPSVLLCSLSLRILDLSYKAPYLRKHGVALFFGM
jgi:hypothetical protein